MPAELTFGEWLRRRRLSLGLTQPELGQRTGYSEHSLRAVEADKRRPSREMAQRLAAALDVPTEDHAAFVRFARDEAVYEPFPLPATTVAPIPQSAPKRSPTNLPTPLTPLIGRETEMTLLRQMLQQSGIRLLSLTGAGGSGKTRLALAIAADVLDQFRDGVFFVNLAPLQEPALVISTIAQVLEMREQGGQALLESLKAFLADKRLLLVLDNFEHVVEAAAAVVAVLEAAPRVKALVTSRVVLRVRGEQDFPLAPLALPDLNRLPRAEHLSQYGAIALFVQRAVNARPDFQVTNQNAPALAQICWRLDGLPLAIELAAARTRLLTPQAMLDRLERPLTFLVGGARDMPTRQQTLRDTIEWSYQLLDEQEKALFRRLAVFVGGCTLEAIEPVCNADGAVVDVLAGVESLVAKSLLLQQSGVGDEPRFTMLETIREYALEQMVESGEVEATRYAYAHFFLQFAERVETHLYEREYSVGLDHLEEEYGNLRTALAWSLDRGEWNTYLRLAGALSPFWHMREHLIEGRHWIEHALAVHAVSGQPKAQVKALLGAGWIEMGVGRYADARTRFEAALTLSRELADDFLLAQSLFAVALAAWRQGNHNAARAAAEESLPMLRELGHTRDVTAVIHVLGLLARGAADYQAADRFLEEALALGRAGGDDVEIVGLLNSYGEIAREQGDFARAEAFYEEAVVIAEKLPMWKTGLLTVIQANRGHVALCKGDDARAEALFKECVALLGPPGIHSALAFSVMGLAGVWAMRRQPKRAAQLLGSADRFLELSGLDLEPLDRADYERIVDAILSQLDEETWSAAWAEGKAMTLEAAVAYALEDEELDDSAFAQE